METRARKDGGYSLVEIVIAAVIFGIVATASMKAFQFISKQSVRVDERAYAVQKCIQMMEELRSLLQDDSSTISILDNYDNGNTCKYTLSTLAEVNGNPSAVDPGDNPADPISGNADLKYMRKVTVNPTNEPLSRQVYVRVYRAKDGELLAETSSVLRTLPPSYVPTQIYDVFVLVLENVPGWWVALSTLAPTFDAIIQDLETRNPGLALRVHYITRLAYGRDPYYRPYINVASPTNSTVSPSVYFMPGNIDNSFTYYNADAIHAKITQDGVPTNDNEVYPYSMADQFNNAVREPDEERMFAEHYAAAQLAGGSLPEVSYRMLLDRMNGGPGTGPDGAYDYTNILLINLHGEMVPMPPLRNYSDPAKRPTGSNLMQREVRAVTHPENIRYASGSAVKLRVYSFVTDPTDTANFPDNNGAVTSTATLTVTIVNTSVLNTTIKNALDPATTPGNIRMLPGNSSTVDYVWQNAAATDATAVNPVGTSSITVVTLYGSPLRHAERTGGGGANEGLDATARLYGLEYIPCVTTMTVFMEGRRDLADNTANVPKNTARWTINIPAGILPDGRTEIDTRIGTDLTTGISTEPANLSRTYVWVGSTASVPMSEYSQFMGDPRYMPYADLKAQRKYNWFFKDVNAGAAPVLWANFVPDSGASLFAGFGDNSSALSNVDVPRFWELLRRGLLKTTGIWNSVSGWSFYYMGLGGDMGIDGNTFPTFTNGLPIMGAPWTPNNGAVANVDEISQWGGATQRDVPIIAHATNSSGTAFNWFSLPWMGELYPSNAALDASAVWVSTGNLPTGNSSAAARYMRDDYNDVNLTITGAGGTLYTGAVLSYTPRKQAGVDGAPSFYNGNASGSGSNTVNHGSSANTATLTAIGTTVSQDFNFPLVSPLTDPSLHRYFSLTDSNYSPLEWSQPAYTAQRSTMSIVETYYDSSNAGYTTSSLVQMRSLGQYAYFQINGMSPQGDFGSAQIGKLALTNVLRGFMTLGLAFPAATAAVPQIPLVSISSPAITDEFNAPTTINVVWSSTWTRWDSLPYTAAYATVTYSGPSLTYNLKYSPNGGSNWYFIDSSGNATLVAAKTGVPNSAYNVTPPLTWQVPAATFPQGNYLLMVEAYRSGRNLHYAYHQRRVFIRR